jgi:hypothetical protein
MAKDKDKTPESNSDPFNFDNLTAVHNELQEQSSDPNVEAIAAHTAKQVESVADKSEGRKPNSGTVDSTGASFDPSIHAVNAEGEPSVTPKGKFRKKRGVSKSVISQTSDAVKAAQEQQQRENAARAAGRVAVDMSIQSLTMLLGPEWEPVQQNGIDERQNLHNAFGDYFVAKDINDFPPGVALSIVCMAYALPRLTTGTETKTRLSKAKIWFNDKMKSMKRKRKNGAQSDSGNDGKRENDTSKTAMSPKQDKGTRHARS